MIASLCVHYLDFFFFFFFSLLYICIMCVHSTFILVSFHYLSALVINENLEIYVYFYACNFNMTLERLHMAFQGYD